MLILASALLTKRVTWCSLLYNGEKNSVGLILICVPAPRHIAAHICFKGSSSQKLCDKNISENTKSQQWPMCIKHSPAHTVAYVLCISLPFICSVSSQPKNEGNIEVTFIFKLPRFNQPLLTVKKKNVAQPSPTRWSSHLPCIDILLEFAERLPLKYICIFLHIYKNKFLGYFSKLKLESASHTTVAYSTNQNNDMNSLHVRPTLHFKWLVFENLLMF